MTDPDLHELLAYLNGDRPSKGEQLADMINAQLDSKHRDRWGEPERVDSADPPTPPPATDPSQSAGRGYAPIEYDKYGQAYQRGSDEEEFERNFNEAVDQMRARQTKIKFEDK